MLQMPIRSHVYCIIPVSLAVFLRPCVVCLSLASMLEIPLKLPGCPWPQFATRFVTFYLLLHYAVYSTLSTATQTDTLAPSLMFSCGVVAGLASSIITQPADVVKTSVQTGTLPNSTGLLPTISSIYQTRGLRAMFAGIAPRVTRRTLMAAFTWAFYEQVRPPSYPLSPSLLSFNFPNFFSTSSPFPLSPKMILISLSLSVLQILLLVDSRFH